MVKGAKAKKVYLFGGLVGITLIFIAIIIVANLSFTGCGGKEEKPTPPETNFEDPDDAASKFFGNISTGGVFSGLILPSKSEDDKINKILERVLGEIGISLGGLYDINIGELGKETANLGIIKDYLERLTDQTREEGPNVSPFSCKDFLKLTCEKGKVEKFDCQTSSSKDSKESIKKGAKSWIRLDASISDCEESHYEEKNTYTVSITGYLKLSREASEEFSKDELSSNEIYSIEDADITLTVYLDNKKEDKVRVKVSNLKIEDINTIDKNGSAVLVKKISGSYSKEDLLTKDKDKDELSFYDFSIQVTSPFKSYFQQKENLPVYISLSGKYSVKTETAPNSCTEGVFSFKTIEPLEIEAKKKEVSGYLYYDIEGYPLCQADGKIEVNNAKINFSPKGDIKVTVGNDGETYSCGNVNISNLCK